MENVVLSWGFQVTGLECPFPCICVGATFVCVCLCQNIANPQSRGGILYGPDGQLILSLLQRGGGEEGQHAEALTQLITHTDN